MLQFCEDIGAKAMFVCNVGLGCQYRMGDASSENKIAYYLDDCMDAIEYAIGDVTGPRRIMLAHMAAAEAHTAVHNILHPEKKKVQSYTVVPSAIFTSPEIGDVGLTEEQAREQGIAVRSAVFQFRELGKAQAMGALSGLFKIVAEEGTGKLLGVHIAGAHASDLIAEATFALQKGCSARDLFETIHAHPTLSEGLYEAAGMLA